MQLMAQVPVLRKMLNASYQKSEEQQSNTLHQATTRYYCLRDLMVKICDIHKKIKRAENVRIVLELIRGSTFGA